MKKPAYIVLYILSLLFAGESLCFSQSEDIYTIISTDNFQDYSPFQEYIDFDNINYPLLNAAIFFETNRVRLKKRLSELSYHKSLEKSSTLHSKQMVEEDFFDHYNKKNRKYYSPKERVALQGVKNPYPAENIAEEFGLQYKSGDNIYMISKGNFSYKSDGDLIPHHTYLSFAEALVDSWMHSPPHKANILSKDAISLGCGCWYFEKTTFNSMPVFKATQNFQLYEPIEE